jgi:hypothetical protein
MFFTINYMNRFGIAKQKIDGLLASSYRCNGFLFFRVNVFHILALMFQIDNAARMEILQASM